MGRWWIVIQPAVTCYMLHVADLINIYNFLTNHAFKLKQNQQKWNRHMDLWFVNWVSLKIQIKCGKWPEGLLPSLGYIFSPTLQKRKLKYREIK